MTRRRVLVQLDEDGPLDRKFGMLVKETLDFWHVPGVSIAVVDGDYTWAKVFPSRDASLLILTALPGLWHLLIPFHTSKAIDAFLCRKYNESIHGSYHVLSCR